MANMHMHMHMHMHMLLHLCRHVSPSENEETFYANRDWPQHFQPRLSKNTHTCISGNLQAL
jgi:hypothetical protein